MAHVAKVLAVFKKVQALRERYYQAATGKDALIETSSARR
jgi:hypothetical protein